MKILHVVRGLANSSGTTHIVVPLAEEQARQGAEVSVYHVAKGREAPVVPDASLVPSGIAEISRLQEREGYAYMRM